MKAIFGFILLITSLSAFGQYPEPTNFDFNYEYIMIDDAGYCAGQYVYGPTYCSHFVWSTPDTNTTNSVFEYYKLYYFPYDPSHDTTVLTNTTELYFDMEIGILGEIWVTAVYSNPDGESEPSNVIVNEDLPISVKDNNLPVSSNILYDIQHQQITVINPGNVSRINIFNGQGKLVHSEAVVSEKISIHSLPNGFYIVELLMKNRELQKRKIIKN